MVTCPDPCLYQLSGRDRVPRVHCSKAEIRICGRKRTVTGLQRLKYKTSVTWQMSLIYAENLI